MKLLTISSNLTLHICNTLKNLSKSVTLPDYEQYRLQARLFADKVDFIEVDDTLDDNACRLLAYFLYSPYSKRCRFSWEHYYLYKNLPTPFEKQQEYDKLEAYRDYCEICHILQDNQEPYSSDLREHASNLRDYIENYLQGSYSFQENRSSNCRKVDRVCKPYRDKNNRYCQPLDKTVAYASESILDLIRTYQSVRWLKENSPADLQPSRGVTCVYFRNEEDAKKYASEYMEGSATMEPNEVGNNFCVKINLDFGNDIIFECSYEALEYKMSKDNDSDYTESDDILD